ncbi:MAG: hypothetical protein OEX04_12750 [Acidimicrobiia bacterium]|nr:hypothetical protein [Acidimicrobiia bacterium]MDH4308338.1 hypothetical protein [Acidimicrobiia bacterium]MDH5294681.1 hypothetical protein [Acidimicrobiia bacterium]
MAEFNGKLLLQDMAGTKVKVHIDLDAERLLIKVGDKKIGEWPLDEVGVRGEDDGFHLRIEGEEVIVTTDDDPGFARMIGLHSASPILRRRMSGALHED